MADAICYASAMDPLNATIEEFATDGFTHVQCYCSRCRMMRLRPISWLPRISMGLTIAQLVTEQKRDGLRNFLTVKHAQFLATPDGIARRSAGEDLLS